ncbi:MAG: hypothetical protein Tsb0021_12130 [Chlamydiales bacterium]
MIEAALILLCATIILSCILHQGIKIVSRKVSENSVWHSILKNSAVPLQIFLWGYGIILTLAYFNRGIEILQQENIYLAKRLFSIMVMGWIFFRCKIQIEKGIFRFLTRRSQISEDPTLFETLSRILSVIIFCVMGSFVLDALGFPLSALLAFGGVGGLAFSLAAKDVIANFFGGMMIHVTRPFAIGDWIMSPNKHFEGFVEEIGWYRTRIRTFERRPTYIPNSIITDAIIENPGRMYNRRIRHNIGLRYSDLKKIKPIIADIESMLKQHPGIDKNQLINVRFIAFGAHSLEVELYCFTKATKYADYRKTHEDLLFGVADILEQHGAEIAFPTSTVHIENEGTRIERNPQHIIN